MNICLTIAGSDSSGGAGIQADLKTFQAHGVFGASVLTAITAQNTLGIRVSQSIESLLVSQQLSCVIDDLPPAAIKIGMLANAEIVETVVQHLSPLNAVPIVVDPVIISTSGRTLLSQTGLELLVTQLLPLATVITPNTDELKMVAELFGVDSPKIQTHKQLEQVGLAVSQALAQVSDNPPAMLCKGGHLPSGASDLLIEQGQIHWLHESYVNNPNTHGTGCTLSAAITANLANGLSVKDSIHQAKRYLHSLILKKLNLGQGIGPLDHTV